jgi:peptidyl carrier protein
MSGTQETVAQTVAKIWNSVLDVPAGAEDATFFELSGQSITAVLIVNRIEEETGVVVDVAELFDDPDLGTFTETVIASAA